jgi:catechol 2,3-dioxygenase-like lactoylglutathione lyase family enzyme
MGLHHLDHYNIQCVNLNQTIKFYCDILGLHVGDRPPLPFPGAWLYTEDGHATIHVIGTEPGEPDREKVPSGLLHHICFSTTGMDDIQTRLDKADIPFRKVVLPGVHNTQFFMQDPNGINVELNFPVEETKPQDLEMMKNKSKADFISVPVAAQQAS